MIQIKALQITHLFFFFFLCVLVNTQYLPKYNIEEFKQLIKTQNKTIVIVVPSKDFNENIIFFSYFNEINSKLKDFVFVEVDKINDIHPSLTISLFPIFLIYKNGYYISGFSSRLENKEQYIANIESISYQKPSSYQKLAHQNYSLNEFKEYCKTENRTIVIANSLSSQGSDFYTYYDAIKILLKDFVFINVNVDKSNNLHPDVNPLFTVYKNCYYINSIPDIIKREDFLRSLNLISKKSPSQWQPPAQIFK